MKINFLCIFLLILTECTDKTVNPQLYAPLLNKQWMLVSIQNTANGQIINFPDNLTQKEWILFNDSMMRVDDGCNGCAGNYYLTNDNMIHIYNMTCTQKFCINYIWNNYLDDNLSNAIYYRIMGNQLTLFTNGTYNLNFVSQ